MGLEAIKEIKMAEDEGLSLIREAQQKSRDIIKMAHLQGDKEYKHIIDTANEHARKIIEDEQEKARINVRPILADGQKEVDEILNLSAEKLNEAVHLILERIVKANGNC